MPIEIFSRVRDGTISQVSGGPNVSNIRYTHNKKHFHFKINRLWDKGEDNEYIFNDLIERKKLSSHIFWVAFGYTGSGKTYTIYSLLEELLYSLRKANADIDVSAYQIYDRNIYDMLNNNQELKIYKTNNLVVNGLTTKRLTNIREFITTIQSNRAMASTKMNDVSSRSHAMIEISVGRKKYTLVDMAGQESGATCSDNEKLVQKQGRAINLNMLALKECIRRYNKKEKHIPFRGCLLTLALKPMFMEDCYVAFICTLSTKHSVYYQMDSLRYASALYDNKETNKEKLYYEVFDKYTKYINEVGWIGCEERELWRRMRGGNFNRCHKLRPYIKEKLKHIHDFSRFLKKYEKILPDV